MQKRVIGAHHRALPGALLERSVFFNLVLGGPDGRHACVGFAIKTNGFCMFLPEARVKMLRPNRLKNEK